MRVNTFRDLKHEIEPDYRGGRDQRLYNTERGRGRNRGGRYFNDDTDIIRETRGGRGDYGRLRRGGYHQHFDGHFENETHQRRGEYEEAYYEIENPYRGRGFRGRGGMDRYDFERPRGRGGFMRGRRQSFDEDEERPFRGRGRRGIGEGPMRARGGYEVRMRG